MKKMTLNLLAVLAVMIVIGLAGRMDYNEEVIYHMSNGTYEMMKEKLGDVSSSELVDEYMQNKEYWDSLGQLR